MAYTPVSQRGGGITNPKPASYIPIAQRISPITPISPIGSIVSPLKLTTQTSTPFMIPKGSGTIEQVGGFAKLVFQETAKNFLSAAMSLSKLSKTGIAEPIQASDLEGSFFTQALFEKLFGKDAVLKPVETRIAEAEPKIKEWQLGLEETLKTPNLNARERTVLKILANLKPAQLAFTGVMGSVGLDITGFGGLEKNVYKALIEEATEEGAYRLLIKAGVADDLARNFAPEVVKVTTEKEAKALLNNIVKLQEATKFAPTASAYTPVAKRKTQFTNTPIRSLSVEETAFIPRITAVVEGKSAQETIASVPGFLAKDNVERPLLLNSKIVKEKVIPDHGIFSPENLVINANDWDVAIRNVLDTTTGKRNPDGINLIKKIPNSDNYLVIGAERQDGFFTLTHYEVADATDIQKLKSHLGRGDLVGRSGNPLTPDDFLGAPPARGGFEGVLGRVDNPTIVNTTDKSIIPSNLPELPKIPKAPSASKIIGETPQAKVTRTAQERTLLKEKLSLEAQAGRTGAREGKKIGKARAENVAYNRQDKAVRAEQLKSLKGGIKLRAQKDAIINVLKNTNESTDRVKKMIVEHVKDALDPADRGKALTLLRDAKNQRDLTKAFSRINRWAEDAIKRDLKNEILATQKSIMDSPSVAIDYKARIKELMGDFELKGHRESTLERLEATQKFLQAEAAKGNDVEIPKRVLKSLELLNRTPFDEITINQLTGLKAEMELLEDLGSTKFRTIESIWETQKETILKEVLEQGAEPIQKIELIKPEIGERLTLTEKFKNLIWSAGNQAARIDKAISPMDTIFDLLDGGKATYDGANFRFFKGQVDAGYGRYVTRKDALQNPVVELATKHGLDDTNFERMGVVAAREQDGGLEKLLASGFTENQVNAVKLSVGEQEVLDLMRTTFDSQFPEIKDVMRTVYNKPVEKVKNYFSFMTDWKAVDESEVFERFGSQAPEQFGTPRKNVEAGFTQSRVGGDQKIKINALDVFLQHTDNTSYLLELGETSKMLGEVAASPKYAELVGDVGQLMVREWLDVIARKGGAAGAQEIAILNTLRKNVGAGILGLKLSTIAIQPTALIDGMGFIGVKYGRKGVTNFTTSSEWRKFIAKMPEISDRLGGEFALRELTDDTWLQNIQRKGFIPLQKLDQMTAGMVAAGAYERKMIELGRAIDFTKYDPEALAYAQLAVRRTQSSGAFKDVPLAISRGTLTGNRSLDRAILQFQNFLLTRWSRIRHDAIRAGINTKDPKKAIPIFTAIIFAALASSGIRLGVNKIQDFVTGKEDEDSVQEDLTKSFMYELTGNVPFLGTAISMAMYDGEMFPILDAPKGVVSGLNRMITSESEGAKLRGFAEFAGSTGALLGIPGSAQAEQLATGFLQEKDGKNGMPSLPALPKLPKLPKLPSL